MSIHKIFYCTIFFLICSLAQAKINQNNLIKLPITDLTTTQNNLQINIPEDYQALQNKDDFITGKSPNINFIHKNDDPNKWQEIISLNMFKHKNLTGTQITDAIYNHLKRNVTNATILEQSFKQHPYFQETRLALSYIDKYRFEIIYMVYYSTPVSATGIQYTTRIQKHDTPKKIIAKMKNFIDQNSAIT